MGYVGCAYTSDRGSKAGLGYTVIVIDGRDLESRHAVDHISLFSRKVLQCLGQYRSSRTFKTASSACASLRAFSRSLSFEPSSSSVAACRY